jgi:hypothetical protein
VRGGEARRITLVIMAIACLFRLAMVCATTPNANLDAFAYTTVAENIYQHHRVSRSDPVSGCARRIGAATSRCRDIPPSSTSPG